MIKLKNLVSEMILSKGHAGGERAVDLLDFVKKLSKLDFRQADVLTHYQQDQLEKQPVTRIPLDYLKTASQPIGDQANLRLWSDSIYERPFYYIFDFSASTLKDFVVATLQGDRRDLNLAYSPRAAFDLPVFEIHWISVANHLRGRGYAKLLYKIVLQKEGTLYSDDILFAGSYKLWTEYLPKISTWYGGLLPLSWVTSDENSGYSMPIPITPEEMKSQQFAAKILKGFIASVQPSSTLRKLGYNLKGLSFSKGELMVIGLGQSIDVESFVLADDVDQDGGLVGEPLNIVDAAESVDSIPELLQSLQEGYDMELTGELFVIDPNKLSTNLSYHIDPSQVEKARTLVACFQDATAVVKDLGSKVSVTLI